MLSIKHYSTILSMAQSNRKTIPTQFNKSMPYEVWKNKIKMWQLVTSVPKNEETIIVRLESLDNNIKAEKAIDQLAATILNTGDGMVTLLNKLDSVFQSEGIDEAYNVHSLLINFTRAENVNINEYILEYKHLYKKLEDFGMKLPDAILAFEQLDSASLSVDDRKLALALGKDMKFSDMKSALKRLSSEIPIISIKDEEAFHSKLKSRNYVKNKSISKNKQQHNPLDKNGKISKCVICQSIMNWAGKCPHRSESVDIPQENNRDSENTDEEINIVSFTE